MMAPSFRKRPRISRRFARLSNSTALVLRISNTANQRAAQIYNPILLKSDIWTLKWNKCHKVWNNCQAYRFIHNVYQIDIYKYPAIMYRTNEPINGLKWNWTIRRQEGNFKGRIYPNKVLQTSSSSSIFPFKLHHLQILNYAGLTTNSNQGITLHREKFKSGNCWSWGANKSINLTDLRVNWPGSTKYRAWVLAIVGPTNPKHRPQTTRSIY